MRSKKRQAGVKLEDNQKFSKHFSCKLKSYSVEKKTFSTTGKTEFPPSSEVSCYMNEWNLE